MSADPIYTARARLAYWSRKDLDQPEKALAARREFEIIKLEIAIQNTLTATGSLTSEERARLLAPLFAA